MTGRTLIAFVLSMLILLIWMALFQPSPPQEVPQREYQQDIQKTEEPVTHLEPVVGVGSVITPGVDYEFVTQNSNVVVNSLGGVVTSWVISGYGKPLELVTSGEESRIGDVVVDGKSLKKQSFSVARHNHDSIDFVTHFGTIKILKRFRFSDEGHTHQIEISVTNTSDSPVLLDNIALCLGPGLNLENTGIREPGLAYALTDGEFKKLKKKGVDGRVDWAGVSNRFFLMAYLSDEPSALDYVKIYSTKKEPPIIGVGIGQFQLRPGERKSIQCGLLACPKAHDILEPLGRSLTKSVDFGVFAPLSRFFLFLLKVFNSTFHNYGVAIILLTIVIYGALSPFTIKSYRSMDRMRVLQPKVKELQTKYKGDSQRLNVEMMNLYKSHKVNPLGGCLPMLLQMPVLFGLFMTLRSAVELRGAPFVWWINDLSAPETLFSLGTFPVRALPLIMGITMFIQQRLSASGDPAQSRMMLIMPVMMLVLFWNFPSGLVLYFLVSNLLGMLQQWIVRRAGTPA